MDYPVRQNFPFHIYFLSSIRTTCTNTISPKIYQLCLRIPARIRLKLMKHRKFEGNLWWNYEIPESTSYRDKSCDLVSVKWAEISKHWFGFLKVDKWLEIPKKMICLHRVTYVGIRLFRKLGKFQYSDLVCHRNSIWNAKSPVSVDVTKSNQACFRSKTVDHGKNENVSTYRWFHTFTWNSLKPLVASRMMLCLCGPLWGQLVWCFFLITTTRFHLIT